MFCSACGQPLEPKDRFCTYCGNPVTRMPATASAAAPPEPEPTPAVPEPTSGRILRSTTDVFSHSSLSGTSSFHTAPLKPMHASREPVRVPQEPQRQASEMDSRASEQPSTRADSVFTYRTRPNSPITSEAEQSPAAPSAVAPQPPVATQQCPSCGKPNTAHSRFCEGCGARLDSQPSPPRDEYAAASPLASAPPASETVSPPQQASAPSGPDAAQPYSGHQVYGRLPTAYDNLPYETDLPPEPKSGKLLWVAAVLLLIAALGAIVWMLRSSRPSSQAAGSGGSVGITLTPALARVGATNGLDLTATVSGAEAPEVTWTVQEGPTGGHVVPRGAVAKAGQVSLAAVYVAPESPGTYHVIVASKADPSKTAVAEVTVTSASPTEK